MARYYAAAIVVVAMWIISSLVLPSRGWAQDGVPIGTVPLFPPTEGAGPGFDQVEESALVQLNLNSLDLSQDTEAAGISGRLAVRSGLHITVTEDMPQIIHLPVQLFGETVLGELVDPQTGVRFNADESIGRGELQIPFRNDSAEGLASIVTSEMTASGDTVSAEVLEVNIAVGPFDMSNDTQIGGSAVIEFTGALVPEVFLTGLGTQSTASVVGMFEKAGASTDEYALAEVLVTVVIDAGYIGSFDGKPVLRIDTDNAWRASQDVAKSMIIGLANDGRVFVSDGSNYLLNSEGDYDSFVFDEISNWSRVAIVLVREKSASPTATTVPATVLNSTASDVASVEPTMSAVGNDADTEEVSGNSKILLIGLGVLFVGTIFIGTVIIRRRRE